MKKILLLLLGLILTTPVYSGTRDPNIPDSKYLEYAKDFHYVGRLCGTYEDDTLYCASAVAIGDHHILTAAHVVHKSKNCKFILNDKEFIIKKYEIPEAFKEKNFGFGDIAIGYSEEPFGLSFYPDLYEAEDEVGKVCCISGYGINGTFNTGAKIADNKKRAGSNVIDYIDRDLLVCSPSLSDSSKRTSLEFIIASGDSGGGLFIDGKLAGINSCVLAADKNPNSTYGDEGCHTRVSKFVSWIR
ncbi:MAG: trypsin-like serine protease, partial [bacterium]